MEQTGTLVLTLDGIDHRQATLHTIGGKMLTVLHDCGFPERADAHGPYHHGFSMTVTDLALEAVKVANCPDLPDLSDEITVRVMWNDKLLPGQQPIITLLQEEESHTPGLNAYIRERNQMCHWCDLPLWRKAVPKLGDIKSEAEAYSFNRDLYCAVTGGAKGQPLPQCPVCKESPAWHHPNCCMGNQLVFLGRKSEASS